MWLAKRTLGWVRIMTARSSAGHPARPPGLPLLDSLAQGKWLSSLKRANCGGSSVPAPFV